MNALYNLYFFVQARFKPLPLVNQDSFFKAFMGNCFYWTVFIKYIHKYVYKRVICLINITSFYDTFPGLLTQFIGKLCHCILIHLSDKFKFVYIIPAYVILTECKNWQMIIVRLKRNSFVNMLSISVVELSVILVG